MRLMIALSAVLAVTLSASSGASGNRFGKGDAIVFGTIENLKYDIVDPDPGLSYGWITANLHVNRVERGRVPSSDLNVKYFAHTYRYAGQEVRLHLRPGTDGAYLICSEGGAGVRCK